MIKLVKFSLYGFRLMRAGAFFAVGLMLLLSSFGLFAEPDVVTEHRLTTLEAKVDFLGTTVGELKSYIFGGLVGTAGLCGEAGIRLVKRKREE